MPKLEDEEARRLTAAVLAMRGVNQRKQKQMRQEGNLKLRRRPMAYKGLSRAWLRNLTNARHEDDWTLTPTFDDELDKTKIPLKHIGCPTCGFTHDTNSKRLRAKIGYGQLTCKRCQHTTTSSTWICNCEVEWHRCDLHVHAGILSKANLRDKYSKRGVESSVRGTNEPLPKRAREEENAIAISSSAPSNVCMELKPGTTLHRLFATRFPHLVQATVPTEGYWGGDGYRRCEGTVRATPGCGLHLPQR